jgi:hypothetical protein
MARIETNGYTFECCERFKIDTSILTPSKPFKIIPGNIKIVSEYACSTFNVKIPKRKLCENTWRCTSIYGYIATLNIRDEKIISIALTIPVLELTRLCYSNILEYHDGVSDETEQHF